jgi:hypothetical protein
VGLYNNRDRIPRVEKLKIAQKTQKFTFKMDQQPENVVLDPYVNLLFDGKLRN